MVDMKVLGHVVWLRHVTVGNLWRVFCRAVAMGMLDKGNRVWARGEKWAVQGSYL